MTDRPRLDQRTDVLPADRLRNLIDRACRHLTPQEANALRGAAAGTMRNATAAVAELHQRLAEQAADLERARRIAVALENELAAAQHQTAIDVQVMKTADRQTSHLGDLVREYKAWGEEQRARAERAEAERDQHAAQLAAARKLHQPGKDWSWKTFGCRHDGDRCEARCIECGRCHPCPTIRALDTALAGPAQPTARRCTCGHPADEHSVYGCADDCACEWMPTAQADTEGSA